MKKTKKKITDLRIPAKVLMKGGIGTWCFTHLLEMKSGNLKELKTLIITK